ncbi:MAG: hypothetical protein ACR2QF_17595 [Geminicoccaceae bacterium]
MKFVGAMNMFGGVMRGNAVPEIPAAEQTFMLLSDQDNPASVSLVSAQIRSTAGGSFIAAVGPTIANDFLIILAPSTFVVVTIINPDFPLTNLLPSYTVTADVRTENTILLTSYVIGPLNADLTFVRQVSDS